MYVILLALKKFIMLISGDDPQRLFNLLFDNGTNDTEIVENIIKVVSMSRYHQQQGRCQEMRNDIIHCFVNKGNSFIHSVQCDHTISCETLSKQRHVQKKPWERNESDYLLLRSKKVMCDYIKF